MEIGIGDRQVRVERHFASGIKRTCNQEIQPDRRIRVGSWLRILSFRNRCPRAMRSCRALHTARRRSATDILASAAVSITHHGRPRQRRDLTIRANPRHDSADRFLTGAGRRWRNRKSEVLAGHLEKAFQSGLDTCLCWRAIVVCRNFLRSQQDVGDLWRLTHRHDNVLQRTTTLFGVLAGKQCDHDPSAMTQINW